MIDEKLAALVEATESGLNEEFGVHIMPRELTLLVGGVIVTGTLCSLKECRIPVLGSSDTWPMIHLKDAFLMSNDGTWFPNKPVYWRGRLEAIDGWFFGRFVPDGE